MYLKYVLILLLLLTIPGHVLLSQDLQFSRVINPFPVTHNTGESYNMPFLGGYNVPRIQFVDIDDDSDKDLFLQEIDDRLSFFENIGSDIEYLYEWRTDDWLGFDHGAWFRFIDIDHDDDLEFFCQGEGTRIRFFENQDGNFQCATDSLKDVDGNFIFSELTSIPEFYDLDCDGDFDLFLGRQSGTITHYENLNSEIDGIPELKFITDRFQDIVIIGGASLNKPTHHGANSLSFGDLNNDGAAELLYGDFFSRSLYYFLNQGACDTTVLERTMDSFPQQDPLQTGGFNRPQLVDIDSDNDLDLFVTILGGFFSFTQNIIENFYYYENTGSVVSNDFTKRTSTFLDQIDVGEESVPAFVDIDADGDLDLFIGNQSAAEVSSTRGQLIYVENTGGSENPEFKIINEDYLIVENIYNLSPTFGDLDSDGDYDLLSGRNNGKIVYWENIGDRFNPQFDLMSITYADIDVGSISVPRLVDIDKDHDLDLIIGEFSGNLNFFVNEGDSSNPVFVLDDENFVDIQTSDYVKPFFGDFDSDGDEDMVIGSGNGMINFYLNNWDGENIQFSEIEGLTLTTQPRAAPVMVDLYAQNQSDLVSGCQGGGLYYFRNTSLSSVNDESNLLPDLFYVSASYPNPFNNRTTVQVKIPYHSSLKIDIYNTVGEKIKTIFNEEISAGIHRFEWNGDSDSGFSASSGLYILHIRFDSFSLSQKIILLK